MTEKNKKLTVREKQELAIQRKKDASRVVVSNADMITANVLDLLYKDVLFTSGNEKGLDVIDIVKVLKEKKKEVESGSLAMVENILSSQVTLLQHFFCRYMTLAYSVHMSSANIDKVMALYQLGLKMQEQSRKTAATLGAIKSPRQTSFIKQQINNAEQQQVNNTQQIEMKPS